MKQRKIMRKAVERIRNRVTGAAASGMTDSIKRFKNDTQGVTTVEVILVLVVLLAIVVIFREQLTAIVTGIFSHVNSTVNELYG